MWCSSACRGHFVTNHSSFHCLNLPSILLPFEPNRSKTASPILLCLRHADEMPFPSKPSPVTQKTIIPRDLPPDHHHHPYGRAQRKFAATPHQALAGLFAPPHRPHPKNDRSVNPSNKPHELPTLVSISPFSKQSHRGRAIRLVYTGHRFVTLMERSRRDRGAKPFSWESFDKASETNEVVRIRRSLLRNRKEPFVAVRFVLSTCMHAHFVPVLNS